MWRPTCPTCTTLACDSSKGRLGQVVIPRAQGCRLELGLSGHMCGSPSEWPSLPSAFHSISLSVLKAPWNLPFWSGLLPWCHCLGAVIVDLEYAQLWLSSHYERASKPSHRKLALQKHLCYSSLCQAFFEGIEGKVAAGVKEEEVGYQLRYSKQELRKLIKEYPGKEVKRSLEQLYRKVEKHLSEEEHLLQVKEPHQLGPSSKSPAGSISPSSNPCLLLPSPGCLAFHAGRIPQTVRSLWPADCKVLPWFRHHTGVHHQWLPWVLLWDCPVALASACCVWNFGKTVDSSANNSHSTRWRRCLKLILHVPLVQLWWHHSCCLMPIWLWVSWKPEYTYFTRKMAESIVYVHSALQFLDPMLPKFSEISCGKQSATTGNKGFQAGPGCCYVEVCWKQSWFPLLH